MKWIYAIFAFLLLSACDGKPKIHFDKMNHDFGITSKMETLTTVFGFTNRGNGTLKIEKVRTG